MPRQRIERRTFPCKCGCGEMVTSPNKWGNHVEYRRGHATKGKSQPWTAERNRVGRKPHVWNGGVEGKVCSRCGEWKPLPDFGRAKTWDGLEWRCRKCASARALAYHHKNYKDIKDRKKNPERQAKIRTSRAAWSRKKRDADPSYKMGRYIRAKISQTFRGVRCWGRFEEVVGCTVEELRAHLESKFQPGMTWDNYGQPGWEMDHITPLAAFDLTDIEQQRKCFHYSNVQPLWGLDNIRKKDKRNTT